MPRRFATLDPAAPEFTPEEYNIGEWIAGFDVIEADNRDAAIELAAAHPMARFGRVEVRPAGPLEFADSATRTTTPRIRMLASP